MYIDGKWIYTLISAASKAIGPKLVLDILKRFKFIVAIGFLLIAALGTVAGIQSWRLHKAEIKIKELELKQEVDRIIVKGFLPPPSDLPENYKEVLQ